MQYACDAMQPQDRKNHFNTHILLEMHTNIIQNYSRDVYFIAIDTR